MTLMTKRERVNAAPAGGLDERGSMITDMPESVRAQVRDAVSQCRGCRLIAGPGCVVDLRVSGANLTAARVAIAELHRP